MKHLQGIASALLTLSIAFVIAVAAWWLFTHQSPVTVQPKSSPSANVAKTVKEEELNTITLQDEAEKRIGIRVTPIEKRDVRRVRVYGGEVVVPVGRTILVAAPLTGIVKVLPSGELRAGDHVKSGQPVFQLTPLLTPDGRATLTASLADTEGQVNNARTQSELAEIALDRAKRVLQQGAGSQRQVDEAQAAYHLATRTLDAMVSRQAVLEKIVGEAESGTTAPILIESPQDGLIRTISALPGQRVPSGAALFEVIDISTIWVRVPLPVGDLSNVDQAIPADISALSASPDIPRQSATPVTAPPSANPLSATVDLYYEVPNPDRAFIPGQRLAVSIPLAGTGNRLTVPWEAVVFDIHGGTWVYEKVGSNRYARRRVTVDYSMENNAVLAHGPAEGTNVVTSGAQELFGAETGFVK